MIHILPIYLIIKKYEIQDELIMNPGNFRKLHVHIRLLFA
jgi:hypothetical protein